MVKPSSFVLRPFTVRKGQVKMFETIGVLIVFFFLLIAGSVFYFGAQTSSIEKERVRAQEQKSLQIVLKALYLPELDCSFLKTQKENCVDVLKLAEFSRLLRNESVRQAYYEEFGDALVTVSEVYPRGRSVVLYNVTPQVERDVRVTRSPMLVFDPVQDTYAFGVIEVRVYD